MLTAFAFLILLVLGITVIAACLVAGAMPGRIARQRNHPQADAISVCGWWGLVTMGILLPVAYIWAYTNPQVATAPNESSTKDGEGKL
jgi:uncharacterized membrane protein